MTTRRFDYHRAATLAEARGEELDDRRIDQATAAAAEEADPEADPIEDLRGPVWYKRRIIRVLTQRALQGALDKL